jgi:16S rRNA (guanine527-N7)-methyltransferase
MTPGEAEEFFRRNGFDIPAGRMEALVEYERLLLEWNAKINLVSRRDTSDFFIRHIVGSISFLFAHSLAPGTSLLDIGTGGGLPGIPLAILYPEIRVTMVDSIQKKVKAVGEIITGLGLPNAQVTCARVEELPGMKGGAGGRAERYDYIIARAVSTASRIVEWCAPMLAAPGRTGRKEGMKDPGGREIIPPGSFILLKGGDLAAELATLGETVGRASVTVRSLEVEGSGDILMEKKVIIITP